MKRLLLLMMASFYTLSAGEPDWVAVAKNYFPIADTALIVGIYDNDKFVMGDDSIKWLPDPATGERYPYTNYYEYANAHNKCRGFEVFIAFHQRMIPAILPVLNIYVWGDIDNNELKYKYFEYEYSPDIRLWHPDGLYFAWHPSVSAIMDGIRVRNRREVKFVNKFLDQPYVFNIFLTSHRNFEYVGYVENGKLVIVDMKGVKYDGIKDLIMKKYCSIERYVKHNHDVPYIDNGIIEVDQY